MELLRRADVADYLSAAQCDPQAIVLQEPLIGCTDVTGITVLRPNGPDMSRSWMRPYSRESIIPTGLRCRDLRAVPACETRVEGPKFGMCVGKGLNIGALDRSVCAKVPSLPPVRCPTTMEFRQLLQYSPMTSVKRDRYLGGIDSS